LVVKLTAAPAARKFKNCSCETEVMNSPAVMIATRGSCDGGEFLRRRNHGREGYKQPKYERVSRPVQLRRSRVREGRCTL